MWNGCNRQENISKRLFMYKSDKTVYHQLYDESTIFSDENKIFSYDFPSSIFEVELLIVSGIT